jgi:hypothetical protein
MKKIAFYTNQLSIRGTEVALYGYAKYNEIILGNKSIIITNPNSDLSSLPKFKERFEVHLLNWYECEDFLLKNEFDFLYIIKMGINDGFVLNTIPTLVHSVFRFNEPHGHKYFYVSDWLAKDQGYDPKTHSLPHICEKLPETNINLRNMLGISDSFKVFGCYGGSTEFNIQFVKDAIIETVNERDDIVFIFMNIYEFYSHPQIKFLPGTYDLLEKSKFVNTCDAMIHARSSGETFGLAISEFALSNKPIITYELSGEKSHIEILGDVGIYYKNKDDVLNIVNNLDGYIKEVNYDEPYLKFTPKNIMDKFNTYIS